MAVIAVEMPVRAGSATNQRNKIPPLTRGRVQCIRKVRGQGQHRLHMTVEWEPDSIHAADIAVTRAALLRSHLIRNIKQGLSYRKVLLILDKTQAVATVGVVLVGCRHTRIRDLDQDRDRGWDSCRDMGWDRGRDSCRDMDWDRDRDRGRDRDTGRDTGWDRYWDRGMGRGRDMDMGRGWDWDRHMDKHTMSPIRIMASYPYPRRNKGTVVVYRRLNNMGLKVKVKVKDKVKD